MKQFTLKDKIKLIKKSRKSGINHALLEFIQIHRNRYINEYNEITNKRKNEIKSMLLKWIYDYNLYGMKKLKSKTGKVAKNPGRPRKVSINDLSDNDREFYQELMEEILEYHNIPQSEVIERLRKKRKEKSINNKKNLSSVLNISRNNLYYFPKGRKYRIVNQIFNECIKKEYIANHKIYGYEKIYRKLKRNNKKISIWKVRKVYEDLNLKSIRTKVRTKKIKEIKRSNVKDNNIPNGNFKTHSPSVFWFTDVSYIKVQDTFYFLSIIIDSYNNEVIDWKISKKHDTKLVIENMRSAYNKRKHFAKALHSDHGFEYTRKEHVTLLKKFKSKRSLSRIGRSLDNRPAEFFFSLLKEEWLNHFSIKTFDRCSNLIKKYVKWYNCVRIQSTLDWKSPKEYFENYLKN